MKLFGYSSLAYPLTMTSCLTPLPDSSGISPKYGAKADELIGGRSKPLGMMSYFIVVRFLLRRIEFIALW